MFQINDVFKYGANGIYKITDIRMESFSGEPKQYYILQSIGNQNSVTYVPLDSETLLARLFPVLTSDAVHTLIATIPEMESEWIADDKERAETQKKLLESDDRAGICAMIKALRRQRAKLTARGKRLRAADETIMNRAEKLLYDEFSLAAVDPDTFWALFRADA